MSVKDELIARSNGVCELCSATEELSVYEVSPSDGSAAQSILACSTCIEQIEDPKKMDSRHWKCLNDSMWNQEPAVQVMAYRMLKRLGEQDLLSMLYLEPEVQVWADAEANDDEEQAVTVRDSNGTTLEAGDSVTIIKDLEVKGAGFTAKRGTVVKNIALNGIEGQIEGRVNGTRIVLLSKFLKKA
ncbi:MAG TPA: PhnA domain protein [Epsilonproteobacteria bacterium]|nr:PhnA domain protein [Campylobacterota bacterium]HHH37604.1 PhnA domain protein [Campylobacterota bacterium]